LHGQTFKGLVKLTSVFFQANECIDDYTKIHIANLNIENLKAELVESSAVRAQVENQLDVTKTTYEKMDAQRNETFAEEIRGLQSLLDNKMAEIAKLTHKVKHQESEINTKKLMITRLEEKVSILSGDD
jgi:chromosome segregation ATPase